VGGLIGMDRGVGARRGRIGRWKERNIYIYINK
jgi:hypothetical protein